MSIIIQCRYGKDEDWKDAFGIESFFVEPIKEATMNPIADMAVNVILSAIFAFMKAQGLSEEEAKTKLWEKVDQIEKLPPLPMDI